MEFMSFLMKRPTEVEGITYLLLVFVLFSFRFAFIEFVDDDVAVSVSQLLDGYRLDKSHVLKATLYSKIDEITSLSETYEEPDPQDYEPKDVLRSWLLNTQPNDQYSILYGETAEIHWNDPTRPPEHIYRRNVIVFLHFSCFFFLNDDQQPSSFF